MPHETLYNLKHNLRKKFGVENKVENFIHSTDPGNEYSKFLSCFFSDAIYKYSNCVDMDVEFTSDDLDYFVKCILKLEKNTNLKYIAVNITNHSPEFANAVVNSKFKRIEVIGLLECCVRVGDSTLILANYFDSKNFTKIFRITKFHKLKLSLEDFMKIQFLFLSVYIKNIFIDDSDLQNFYSYIDIKGKNICENVRKLKCYQTLSYFLNQVHVDGLFCFSPITTLIEGELKMELCEMFHLKQGGGSCMEQELGKFTISLEALLL